MKDADQGTSLQAPRSSPSIRRWIGPHERPPRFRTRRSPPPPSTPAGIAVTVARLLALPIRVVLELGVETARTLGSVFSVRSHDR